MYLKGHSGPEMISGMVKFSEINFDWACLIFLTYYISFEFRCFPNFCLEIEWGNRHWNEENTAKMIQSCIFSYRGITIETKYQTD